MTSIVELGIEIKTDSVVKAADDLDSLTDAGKSAEGAAKQVESSWAKAVAGLRGDTGQIVKELQALNASQAGIAEQMAAIGKAAIDSSASFAAAAKAQAGFSASTDAAAQAGQRMAESAEQQSARMAAVVKASLEASQYHQSLTGAINGTASAMDAAGKSATDWAAYQAEINARGQALLATEERLAQEAKKAAAATGLQADGLQKLLGQIDPTVAALDRLDDQQARLAKYRAAGLLDTETFRDYSTKIDQTRQKLGGFDEAIKQTGTSTAQTQAALRQLPAQFTDIFTSLAGGQSPLMVLIQQGGQIKDSFGGIGPMFDALGEKFGTMFGFTSAAGALSEAVGGIGASSKVAAEGAEAAGESLGSMAEGANTAADAARNAQEAAGALNSATPPLTLNFGLLAAGVLAAATAATGLVIAYKQGSDEASAYNKALAMTGNTAGTTAAQLSVIAAAVSGVNGTVHEAAASLAALASSTRIPVTSFEMIATAAANFEDATDKAAASTVANFEKIAKDPSKALLDLNESMNFLTASTLEQILALERQGKTQEAATLASKTYADALNGVSERVKLNLGTIESAWKDVKDSAKLAWDEMLAVGRDKSFADQMRILDERIAKFKEQGEEIGGSFGKKLAETGIAKAEAEKTQLLIAEEEKNRRAAAKGVAAQIRSDGIEGELAIRKIRNETQSNAEKREKEIADYRRNLEKVRAANPSSALLEEKKVAQDIANIREKWADKKGSSAAAPLDLRSFNDAENALKSLNSTYENSIRVLDAAQKAGAISQSEYTAQKSALLSKQKTDVEAAYQAEISALEVLKGREKLSSAQRIELDNKIADAKQKQNDALKRLSADQEIIAKETEGQLKRQEAAFKAFAQSVDDSLALAQRGLEQQLAGFGMGQEARRRLQEDLKIREDYQKKLEQLTRDFNKIEKPSEEQKALYDKETAYLREALEKRLDLQEDYYRKLEAAQANWANGANAAWQDYIDSASDIAGQTYDVFSNAFSSMEDALVEFAMTGKLSFKEFANSIIADIARIVVRTQIVAPLLNSVFGGGGGITGGAGGIGAMFSDGSGGGGFSVQSMISGAKSVVDVASSKFVDSVVKGWATGGDSIVNSITGAFEGGSSYVSSAITSAFSTGSQTATTIIADGVSLSAGNGGAAMVDLYTGSNAVYSATGEVIGNASTMTTQNAMGSALGQISMVLSYIQGVYSIFTSFKEYGLKGAAVTGGMAAAGAYVGSFFGPLGTAAGFAIGAALGAIGADKWFGSGEKYEELASSASGTYSNGVFSDRGWVEGWKDGTTRFGTDADRTLTGYAQQFSTTLGMLYDTLGNGADVATDLTMRRRRTSGNYSSTFQTTLDNGLDISHLAEYGGDVESRLGEFYDDYMGTFLAQAIVKSTSLPEYFKAQFVQFADDWEVTADTVIAAIEGVFTRFEGVNAALERINVGTLAMGENGLMASDSILNMVASIADLDKESATAKDKVDALNELVNGFYGAFYTAQEQFVDLTETLETSFATFGLRVPETRDAYRAMVEDIDVTTAAGQAMFTTMMGLATAADSFYKTIAERQEAYYSAFYSETENTARSLNATIAQIEALGLTLPATRNGFRQMVEALDLTTEKGKATHDSLMSLAGAVGTVYDNIEQQLLGNANAAFATLQRSINAQKTSINDMITTARSNAAGLTSVSNALSNALKALRGDGDDAVRMLRDQAKATVISALAIARAGGSLSKFEGLEDALGVISDSDTSLYSSLEDFNREQGRNANLIAELNGLNGKQLSASEKTIKALEDQLKGLDEQLLFAQSQLDALNGVDNSVKTVADAIKEMNAAVVAAIGTISGKITAQNAGTLVDSIYQDKLGRPADDGGKQYWVDQLTGGSLNAGNITGAITNAAAIEAAYKAAGIAMNDGAAYWATQLTTGAMTPAQLQEAVRNAAIANGSIRGYATGGLIAGPGTGTSDSILARLSNGEYVMSADAVRMFGTGLLDQMNAGRLPGFSTGGGVGETGPVLQITRPAQIYSQPQRGTEQGGNTAALERKVDMLIDVVKQIVGPMKVNSDDNSKLMKKWDRVGLPTKPVKEEA